MIKTCKLKFKICSHMYLCDGCHDVNTVCVLFLGDARDAYRGTTGVISIKPGGSLGDNSV
jgi:hypothetical protein